MYIYIAHVAAWMTECGAAADDDDDRARRHNVAVLERNHDRWAHVRKGAHGGAAQHMAAASRASQDDAGPVNTSQALPGKFRSAEACAATPIVSLQTLTLEGALWKNRALLLLAAQSCKAYSASVCAR
jgi:hypothetical protein